MTAVFKPALGENSDIKATEFDDERDPYLYIREVTGSLVDRLAQLHTTPPTVCRKINGEIGSLRPYIHPSVADTPEKFESVQPINWEEVYKGDCWLRTACLDRLIGNCDRSLDNFLIYFHDQSQLESIDLGFSFPPPGVVRVNENSNVAYNYFANSPDKAKLTDEIRRGLESLLTHEQELLSPIGAFGESEDESRSLVPIDTTEKRIARLLFITEVFDIARQMLVANSIVV